MPITKHQLKIPKEKTNIAAFQFEVFPNISARMIVIQAIAPTAKMAKDE